MKSELTSEDVQRFERRLQSELAKLDADIEQLEQQALEPSGQALQEEDESLEEAALEADLSALDAQDELGYEVREALERIAAGTYGTCESCEQPISRARLETLPQARLCETCAREASALP